MAADEVLDEKPVPQQPRDEGVLLQDPGAVEATLLAHGTAQDPESLDEVVGAEVVQSGLRAGGRHEVGGLEDQPCARLFHEVENGASMKSRMARTSAV